MKTSKYVYELECQNVAKTEYCGDNDIISLSNKDWDDIGIVSTNEDLECQDREVKPKVSSSEASLQDIEFNQ